MRKHSLPFSTHLNRLHPYPGSDLPREFAADSAATIIPCAKALPDQSRNASHRRAQLPAPGDRTASAEGVLAFRFDATRRARLPAVPPDPATDALQGQAYLAHIAADPRLMPAFRGFVRRHFPLDQSPAELAEAHAFAERIRPIVAQACTDPELARTLEADALDSLNECVDRSEFFMSQMQVSAVLSALGQGRLDKHELFELGIGFFKLHEVRAEVGRRTGHRIHFQNLHDYLDAEFQLQDELGLPVRHDAPALDGFSLLDQSDIRAIGRQVKKKLVADDGAAVLRFLANWEPWQKAVLAGPGQAALRTTNEDRFADRITDALTQRADPTTAWGQCRETDFEARIQAIERERVACIEDHMLVMTRRFLADAFPAASAGTPDRNCISPAEASAA